MFPLPPVALGRKSCASPTVPMCNTRFALWQLWQQGTSSWSGLRAWRQPQARFSEPPVVIFALNTFKQCSLLVCLFLFFSVILLDKIYNHQKSGPLEMLLTTTMGKMITWAKSSCMNQILQVHFQVHLLGELLASFLVDDIKFCRCKKTRSVIWLLHQYSDEGDNTGFDSGNWSKSH